MSEIKAILWDIDGTLLDFEKAEKKSIKRCFDKFGLGMCSEEMLASYHIINRRHWAALERGEMSKQEVLEGRFIEFFKEYGIDTSIANDFNLAYQLSLGDTSEYCVNAYETVVALRDKVKQYAVTNGTKTAQEAKLNNTGLIHLLDGVFISDIIGHEKPSVEFFNSVFKSLGEYDKSEMIIIGDSLTSDIQGGNNVGIKTCFYNPKKNPINTGLRIDYEISDLAEVMKIV